MTAAAVAKASQQDSKNSFTPAQVSKWEGGKLDISYRRLVEDILPAYGIEDFDEFVDFCHAPSLDQIKVIDHFSSHETAGGATVWFLDPGILKGHRSRIDRLTFPPGTTQATPWGRHDGHEFVLVVRGHVLCEFACNKDGERKRYSLKQYMAIAFHSGLFHQFSNASDSEEAELVAAKPSHSHTAAKWRQSHP